VTAAPFRFDEVGYWSELKLEIVERYGSAYTTAFANQKGLKKYYIDAFSGAGVHVSKRTGGQIEGSPARALKVSPPFDHFYFIDMEPDKTKYLAALCANRSDVTIHTGDSTRYLTEQLLPTIRYKNFNRALCLLDPYGLHLDWEVMLQAGQSRAIDMFLNFPVMDMNRNAIWRNPDKVPQDGIERMTRFWGDESWKKAAYAESPQQNLFSAPALIKQGNDAIVRSFRDRLKKIAGFSVVPEPLPMKNSNNAVVYYLFFASQKPVAQKIIDDIFAKFR
jgi:three-Cys-motif partner protein